MRKICAPACSPIVGVGLSLIVLLALPSVCCEAADRAAESVVESAVDGSTRPRPNILWLSCEDISPHLGCYDDPHAITPHLDGLAKDAVRYRHAYTTAGVCAPCRSAIITGLYQTTLGTHHMRCQAKLPAGVKPFPTYLRQAGYYCSNNRKQDYQFRTPKGTWDASHGKAHWRQRPDPQQPFFAVFNFGGCHESGIADDNKYRAVTAGLSAQQRQDPKKLALPPYYPDTPKTREDWKRNYELITAMDAWAGDLIVQLKEDGLYENTIIFFWSDHGVGLPRAKRWLYDSGTHIPLIIRIPAVWRSDHRPARGSWDTQLVSSLDFAPTVLNLAGLPIPDVMQGRAFAGQNLTPPRRYVYGARDRMDERYDIIRAVRDSRFRYIRNYEPGKPYYQYMNTPEKGVTMQELRRVHAGSQLPHEAALFMADRKPAEELYDLDADPHEVHNLASSAEHGDVLQRLRAAHLDWVSRTRDLGLVPESELERAQATGVAPYDLLSGDTQRMDGIRQAANLASGVNAANAASALPELVALLSDEDAVVRYWAATGLGNLTQTTPGGLSFTEIRQSAEPALLASLKDAAPCVRIAAARALLGLNLPEQALSVLQSELSDDSQWARLQATIVLDEAGEWARPLIPELTACLENQPNKYITRVANHALNILQGTQNVVK